MAQNDTSHYIGADRKQEALRDTKPQRGKERKQLVSSIKQNCFILPLSKLARKAATFSQVSPQDVTFSVQGRTDICFPH